MVLHTANCLLERSLASKSPPQGVTIPNAIMEEKNMKSKVNGALFVVKKSYIRIAKAKVKSLVEGVPASDENSSDSKEEKED